MTNEKLKDLFSAYHENTLDAGLRSNFRARLEQDQILGQEYKEFEDAILAMETLKDVKVAIPENLHDLVMQKIDHSAWQTKQSRKPSFLDMFKRVAVGGIAVLAIVAGYISLDHRSSSDNMGGFGSTPADQLEIVSQNGALHAVFTPTSAQTIQFSAVPSGKVIRQEAVNAKQQLNVPLQNNNASASAIAISVDGQSNLTYVIIAGSKVNRILSGTGNLLDFGKAIASTFHRNVVVIDQKSPISDSQTLNWKLDEGHPVESCQEALSGTNYSADIRNGDVIYITKSS